jgi:hypothetical protein
MRCLTLAAAWIFLAVSGCGTPPKTTGPSGPKLAPDTRLLMLPFEDMTQIYGTNEMIKCPVCDSYFNAGPVSVAATDFLTRSLLNHLEKKTTWRLEFQTRVSSGFISDGEGGQKIAGELDNLILEGRAVNVAYLMTGYVYRFRERVGKGYSAEAPASVAFSVHLIDVFNRRVAWTGIYNETQQALSDNLFNLGTFLNRGGGWVTAEELAEAGLETLIDRLVGQ